MNRKPICPITYEAISPERKYSVRGLHILSNKLNDLADLPYTEAMQRYEALKRADKMSIQGVQPKLSAVLNIKNGCFDIVDRGGKYILKPQHDLFLQAPENEDLTMRLASLIGIEVPVHGLVYSIDGKMTYFIKRFDRAAFNKKIAVEDFAQLTGNSRDTKYNFSMEKLIPVIEKYCTFPIIEKTELFRRTLFNFLIGNEDMHLKNFSLITRKNKVEMAPAYDFLNSTILLSQSKEEIALSLKGKKNNLARKDFINYFAKERLLLSNKVINQELKNLEEKLEPFIDIISNSFLGFEHQEKYKALLIKRHHTLFG